VTVTYKHYTTLINVLGAPKYTSNIRQFPIVVMHKICLHYCCSLCKNRLVCEQTERTKRARKRTRKRTRKRSKKELEKLEKELEKEPEKEPEKKTEKELEKDGFCKLLGRIACGASDATPGK